MTAHLGYGKHERVGQDGAGNARNGSRSKTVLTKAGPIEIDVPRDRAGTFTPAVVVKIRDGQVANRPNYVALAVTAEGNRDILGLWACGPVGLWACGPVGR